MTRAARNGMRESIPCAVFGALIGSGVALSCANLGSKIEADFLRKMLIYLAVGCLGSLGAAMFGGLFGFALGFTKALVRGRPPD